MRAHTHTHTHTHTYTHTHTLYYALTKGATKEALQTNAQPLSKLLRTQYTSLYNRQTTSEAEADCAYTVSSNVSYLDGLIE